jgi:hypothetical protein
VPSSNELQKEMKIESKKVRRLERAAAAKVKGTASATTNLSNAAVESTPTAKTFYHVHSVAEHS